MCTPARYTLTFRLITCAHVARVPLTACDDRSRRRSDIHCHQTPRWAPSVVRSAPGDQLPHYPSCIAAQSHASRYAGARPPARAPPLRKQFATVYVVLGERRPACRDLHNAFREQFAAAGGFRERLRSRERHRSREFSFRCERRLSDRSDDAISVIGVDYRCIAPAEAT